MAQMEELQSRAVARDKRDRRHRHEVRQKARVRAAQLALGEYNAMTQTRMVFEPQSCFALLSNCASVAL